MGDIKELVKKDLFEIYNYLYYVFRADNASRVFSPKITNKFKYSPSEVASILEISDNKHDNERIIDKYKEDIGAEISKISNLDSLREFYNKNLSQLFNAGVDEDTKNKIINSISVKELKCLWELISSIPIKSGKNKKDIIYMFKYYFDDEARTDSMIRNLK